MVEINNQRKAFLDMLAWSEGIDNGRQKTRNHGYDVIVGGELFTDYSDYPRKLVTLNPNSNPQAPDATSFFPVGGMPTASSLPERLLSGKVRTLWHCSRLRSVALYLWLIVDIRQAIDRCSNIWASLPGAGYGHSEHKADSLIAKFKEAGGTVREIDAWAESPRLSPLWLSASSSACHGLLIITVITPLPTKPSAPWGQRTEAGERGNYWHADASAWCCCARCKIHRRS